MLNRPGLAWAFVRAGVRAGALACLVGAAFSLFSREPPPGAAATGIHKIRHVVIIMQENRSFDSFFGTFPGADGIPMRLGVPAVCVPDPYQHRCVRPFHTA